MANTNNDTGLPTFRILSGGSAIPSDYGVAAFAVRKQVNRIPSARLVLFDGSVAEQTFKVSGAEEFVPGKEIEIQAGYNNQNETIFRGIVIRHAIKTRKDQPGNLILDLKDVAIKMTVGKKNTYFTEVTDSDVIEEVLGRYGDITPEVEATNDEHAEMTQYYCTDWDFMMSRADANGMLAYISDGTLAIKTPAIADPVLELEYGRNMIEFEAGMDVREQYKGTLTRSWDYSSQEMLEAEGADPGLEEAGNLSADELADVIGLEQLPMQHGNKLTTKELEKWASAKLLRSRLAKVRGRVRIFGNNVIKPGDTIELLSVGDRFLGKAFVSGVLHQLSANSQWVTDIQFGLSPKWFSEQFSNIMDKPAAGLLPAVYGLQNAVVTQLHEDPAGEDRIKVRVPVMDAQAEGIWARMATLDAGDSRGVFFRPEVGDEVIVGFVNDDPRAPVILGMLHSQAKPSPVPAEEENNIKGIITRSEIKLLFDDDLKVASLETPGGNKYILNDDEEGILIEDMNGNMIEMSPDGITIKSAKKLILDAPDDVEINGKNITAAAQSAFKAEGSSSADFTTNGKATIKGSLVGIN
ncbi:MAG: type VI secretion system tip protein VgrG [Cyclobacteriaceae bacterium]